MYKVKVVCPARYGPGFALAGFATETYQEPSEAEARLVRTLEDPDCGVLIMDEAVVPSLGPRIFRRLEASDRPLVVAIPMGPGAAAEREYLERVIRRVIGYQVRLK